MNGERIRELRSGDEVAAMSRSLRTNAARVAILAVGLFVTRPLIAGDRQYGQGAGDTEIKIGQDDALQRPLSVSSAIGKVQAAYFRMINDHGGVNGREINLISSEDAATPPDARSNRQVGSSARSSN